MRIALVVIAVFVVTLGWFLLKIASHIPPPPLD